MASGIQTFFHAKREGKTVFEVGVSWADYEKPRLYIWGFEKYLSSQGLERLTTLQGISFVPFLSRPEREGEAVCCQTAEEIFLYCQAFNGREKKSDAQSLRHLYSLVIR